MIREELAPVEMFLGVSLLGFMLNNEGKTRNLLHKYFTPRSKDYLDQSKSNELFPKIYVALLPDLTCKGNDFLCIVIQQNNVNRFCMTKDVVDYIDATLR